MATKRRRKPAQTGNTDEKIQFLGPSISDLPVTIFVDILLKLSTRSIILCKCVCKTWHSIISDPQFARLHLAQAKTCLLIRDLHYIRVSRALHLLEPEDGRGFDVGYCWCGSVGEKCKRCRLCIKVKAKLKIPLRNAKAMFNQVGDDTNAMFCTNSYRKRTNFIKLDSSWDHKYKVANSCNGLLCLADKLGYDPVVVCNPILDEFIYLPKSSNDGNNGRFFWVGLGFSPKNNQFKVIRFPREEKDPATGICLRLGDKMADIHTLGTVSWRSVSVPAFKLNQSNCPIYLEGALHWIHENYSNGSECIVCFDLDVESFHFYSIPSPPCQQFKHLDMRVLGGFLCVYDTSAYDHIDIWVMKEYGVCESWTKLFSIGIANDTGSRGRYWYRPISYLNNGALLMSRHRRDEYELVYYDELRGLRFRRLKFCGIRSAFEGIAYTPSFISLKDIVMDSNVEVLNVNSRCGRLKLQEENYPLSLGRTKR